MLYRAKQKGNALMRAERALVAESESESELYSGFLETLTAALPTRGVARTPSNASIPQLNLLQLARRSVEKHSAKRGEERKQKPSYAPVLEEAWPTELLIK